MKHKNGQILVQVIVLLILMATVATLILKWSFFSRSVQSKSVKKSDTSSLLENIRSRVYDCLYSPPDAPENVESNYPVDAACGFTNLNDWQKACIEDVKNSIPTKSVYIYAPTPVDETCEIKIEIKDP